MTVATRARSAVVRRTPGQVPWPPVLCAIGAAGFVVGLVAAIDRGGFEPAAQLSGLTLAAAAGYLVDDPATTVTQTVPRPLWRRRAATVVPGLVLLTCTWAGLLALLQWRAGGLRSLPLSIEAGLGGLLALAAAALLCRRGEHEAGNVVAPALLLLGVGVLLFQPLSRVTLIGAQQVSAARVGWWVGIGLCAGLVLLANSRDLAHRGVSDRAPRRAPRGQLPR